MTADEIRQSVSMQDVLMRYGLKTNRNGFMCCCFHNEKTPSMQIKQKSYKCHGCNEYGGVFDFVMKMENCSFKDAYLSLGGEYEQKQNTDEYRQRRKELELKWKMEREKKEYEKTVQEFIPNEMMFYRNECKKYDPFSDLWCFCKEMQSRLEILFDEIFQRKNPFDLEEVFKKYSPIREAYQNMINLRKDNGNE